MPDKTAELPRYKHFTVDPLKPVGKDVEADTKDRPLNAVDTLDDTPPAMSMDEEDKGRVQELSDAELEAHEEREEQAKKDREERAKNDERPTPSEHLASLEGAGTKKDDKKDKQSSSSSSSSSSKS